MRKRFLKELAARYKLPFSEPGDVITDAQLEFLPEPAQHYARFTRVVGRPRDWSFRLGFFGRFRTKPKQPWMTCEAWQYNHCPDVARIFHIRIRAAGVLPVIARDTYVHGRGRMLVRFLDLFTIADGMGAEYDTGELVTYLNDAVMLCPSMLFVPAVSWMPVDDYSFDVSLSDRGRTVTARVFVGANGAPSDFSTTDRFCYDPEHSGRLLRARWTTPVAGWQFIDGRPLPTSGQAVWHFPGGPFPYADFRLIPGSAAFSIPPGV